MTGASGRPSSPAAAPRPGVIVLDTAALIAGLGPAATPDKSVRWCCPPEVRAEIKPGGPTGRAVARNEDAGLQVLAASDRSLARVQKEAGTSGDLGTLSPADLALLALAWEHREAPSEIWSDDYAVQNVARRLGLGVRPVVQEAARETRTWYTRCTGCGQYPDAPQDQPCPICGSPLKRTRRAPGPRRTRR